jgi:hypothetical protein
LTPWPPGPRSGHRPQTRFVQYKETESPLRRRR